jgi:hypothetical protein
MEILARSDMGTYETIEDMLGAVYDLTIVTANTLLHEHWAPDTIKTLMSLAKIAGDSTAETFHKLWKIWQDKARRSDLKQAAIDDDALRYHLPFIVGRWYTLEGGLAKLSELEADASASLWTPPARAIHRVLGLLRETPETRAIIHRYYEKPIESLTDEDYTKLIAYLRLIHNIVMTHSLANGMREAPRREFARAATSHGQGESRAQWPTGSRAGAETRQCYNCHEIGHLSMDYTAPKRDRGGADYPGHYTHGRERVNTPARSSSQGLNALRSSTPGPNGRTIRIAGKGNSKSAHGRIVTAGVHDAWTAMAAQHWLNDPPPQETAEPLESGSDYESDGSMPDLRKGDGSESESDYEETITSAATATTTRSPPHAPGAPPSSRVGQPLPLQPHRPRRPRRTPSHVRHPSPRPKPTGTLSPVAPSAGPLPPRPELPPLPPRPKLLPPLSSRSRTSPLPPQPPPLPQQPRQPPPAMSPCAQSRRSSPRRRSAPSPTLALPSRGIASRARSLSARGQPG